MRLAVVVMTEFSSSGGDGGGGDGDKMTSLSKHIQAVRP